jgi:hypothetical protein
MFVLNIVMFAINIQAIANKTKGKMPIKRNYSDLFTNIV